MRSARLGSAVLVAPAGVMAGHALGYLLAGRGHAGHHAVDHGYLPAAASVAVALFLGTLLWNFARVRSSGPRTSPWGSPASGPPVRLMVCAQWVLFVGQELVEHAAAGDAVAVIQSPALWLGLVSQVAVATAAILLLSAADWAGGRVVDILPAGSTWAPSPRTWPLPTDLLPDGRLLFSTATSRGPPLPRS